MPEYTFTIMGRVPTKKNMMEIRWRYKPRPIYVVSDVFKFLKVGPNKKYREWEHGKAKALFVQRVEKDIERIERPIILECVFYLQSQPGRKPDLSNLIQSVEDALEKGGVIKDDGLVESYGDSRREFGVTEQEERVEIKISLIQTMKEFVKTLPEPAYKKHVHVCEKCGHRTAFPYMPGLPGETQELTFTYKCNHCGNEEKVTITIKVMKAFWMK